MECGLALWQHDNIDKLYDHVAKNYKSMPCQVRTQAPGKNVTLKIQRKAKVIFLHIYFSVGCIACIQVHFCILT